MKPRPKPRPLTNAERCRLYRERIKKNPEQQQLKKEADKERARQNRRKPKAPEEVEKIKEQNRLRQQLYYAKKKLRERENAAPHRPKTRQTEVEKAKMREKNRGYVEKHRKSRSSQKKRRDNEKQLKYYYKKKEEKQAEQQHQQEATPAEQQRQQEATPANSTPYPTQAAYRKAVARVRAKIKAKGSKLAFIFKGLLKFSGRKTRQTLKELNVSFKTPDKNAGVDIRQHVGELHGKRDKGTLNYKRRLSEAFGTQENGFSRRYLTTKTTDLYKRRKVNQTNQLVFRYYEEHSHPDPCKASHTRQLMRPVRDLHQDFLRMHPDHKVSLRHFYRLKPKNVASVRKAKFRQCLCEVCLNPKLKLQTLNRLVPCFRSVRDMLEESVCAFVDLPKLECVERKCRLCGTEQVKEKLVSVLEGRLELTVGWAKWMHVKEGKSSRMDKVKKRGTVSECVNEMIEEIENLYKHVFVAEWQRRQLSGLKADLPEGWALVTCDYAENFLCRFQDEPQSAHWAYKQVTLFPAVIFYRCPDEGCEELRREELAFLSDDLTKDAQLSQVIADKIVSFLVEKLGAGLQKIIFASDGCAAQFKSKVPFLLFTRMKTPGFSVERVYFGSRHGKNDSDWSGGAIKRQVTRDLAAGLVCIRDAQQMFLHCRDALSFQTEHKSRSFEFLPPIQRSLKSSDVKTIPGSRKFHHIRSLGAGVLSTRELSCFCQHCQTGSYAACQNQCHVAQWRIFQIHCLLQEEDEEEMEEDEVSFEADHSDADTDTEAEYDEEMLIDSASSGGEEEAESNVDLNQRFDMNVEISEEEGDTVVDAGQRLRFFSEAAVKMRACRTYKDLKVKCFEIWERICHFRIPNPLSAKDLLHLAQDKTAVDLLDISLKGLCHPLSVPADGNCFFSAASLLLFGDVEHHTELRLRTAVAMCCHEDLFLDGSNWTSPASDGLDPRQVLEVAVLTSVCPAMAPAEAFHAEVLHVVKNSTYAGLWELFALSMALKMPVQSVFPPLGWRLYERHCNRIVRAPGVSNNKKLLLFWSSLHSPVGSAEHWVPNHFVPLVLTEDPSRVPDVGGTYLCPWQGTLYPCTVLETDELMQLSLVQFMVKKGTGWSWKEGDYSWEPTSLLDREIALQLVEELSTQRCQVFRYV